MNGTLDISTGWVPNNAICCDNKSSSNYEDDDDANNNTIVNNKYIIIRDNEKGTCTLIDVAISGDRNVIKRKPTTY